MDTQKSHIHHLEQTLIFTKKVYKEAMQNLSQISEEASYFFYKEFTQFNIIIK